MHSKPVRLVILVGVKEDFVISLLASLIAAIQSNALLLAFCRNRVNGKFLREYHLSGLWEALTKQLGLLLTEYAAIVFAYLFRDQF